MVLMKRYMIGAKSYGTQEIGSQKVFQVAENINGNI